MRIVTRPDFDGVVCASLLRDALRLSDPVVWLEPDEVGSSPPRVRPGDVLANLPWHPACSLWFDHHATHRVEPPPPGLFRLSPSAARNVFDYFAGRFSRDHTALVAWADRIDAAELSCEEILHPERCLPLWVSLTVSAERPQREVYWDHLARLLSEGGIAAAAEDPRVRAACREVLVEMRGYEARLRACTRQVGPVAVSDFRPYPETPPGNRYLVYCLYPEATASLRIRWADEGRTHVTLHLGHSIVRRGCPVHAGDLLSRFGGGGHRGAASVRIPAGLAEEVIAAVVAALCGADRAAAASATQP